MIAGSLTVQFTLLLEFVSLPSFLSLLSVSLSIKQELATGSEEPDQTIWIAFPSFLWKNVADFWLTNMVAENWLHPTVVSIQPMKQ